MNAFRKRRVLNWLNVSLMTLFMAAFLVGVNLVANTRFARIDMTTDKVWEVSAQSKQIVKSVKRVLEIYPNFVSENPASQDRTLQAAWGRTDNLLREFANLNPNLRLRHLRQEDPEGYAEVVRHFSRPDPNTIYFVYRTADEKPVTRALGVRELYEGNPQTGELTSFHGEPKLVTTIAQLISERKAKVYCTNQHREIAPGQADRGGLSAFTSRLTALENTEFKPLDLVREKAVPDDADLVMIVNPISDFTTVETDALAKYWQRGGRLFVAINPLVPDPLSELRKFLESCGVKMNRDIVLDMQRELRDPRWLLIRAFTAHPVNQGMPGAMFRFPFACSVDRAPVNARQQAMPLFLSSPETWAESDIPVTPNSKHNPGEQYGNVSVSVASEEIGTGTQRARMIAWGGVVALTNELNIRQDTPDELTIGYILNNFRWLLEREVLITNPEQIRKPRMKPFAPPPGSIAVIGWISVAGIPLIGVALGMLTWFFRRK